MTAYGDVTARIGGGTWAVAVVAAALFLMLPKAARAEPELVAGMKSIGLGGAVSLSHVTQSRPDTVTGLQLLPHVGYVVTDAHGSGWVRGNLEVLLEPTLIHFEDDASSPTVVGASAITRWVFAGVGRYRPYLEAGVGVLLGEVNLRETDCRVNFLVQGGPGVLVFLSNTTTLTVGYRFQHVSNAGACEFNVGINSSALYLGVSYRFR